MAGSVAAVVVLSAGAVVSVLPVAGAVVSVAGAVVAAVVAAGSSSPHPITKNASPNTRSSASRLLKMRPSKERSW